MKKVYDDLIIINLYFDWQTPPTGLNVTKLFLQNIVFLYINFKISTLLIKAYISKGSFKNYVDRVLPFFDPPSPLRGQFLYHERRQKQTFFDPLPPSSCPRSFCMAPNDEN